MCEIPLTTEQSIFAAKNHGLVYKFLSHNNLPEDEYYDVIIFGYLTAVKNYLTKQDLQIYKFATIAWRYMSRSLSNHKKTQYCQKRNADVISIHIGLHNDDLPLEQILPAEDKLMQQLEENMILHELARRVSKQQMDIVNLRSKGYVLREIADDQNITINRVRKLLNEVYVTLKELCYE